jgi:hypothetical protein
MTVRAYAQRVDAGEAQVSRKPESLSDRFDRLERETSQAGWEDRRSVAIGPEAWKRARDFVRVASREVPVLAIVSPFISPSGDGSINVRWSALGRMAEVELAPNELSVTTYGGRELDSEGSCASMSDVLQRLRSLFL